MLIKCGRNDSDNELAPKQETCREVNTSATSISSSLTRSRARTHPTSSCSEFRTALTLLVLKQSFVRDLISMQLAGQLFQKSERTLSSIYKQRYIRTTRAFKEGAVLMGPLYFKFIYRIIISSIELQVSHSLSTSQLGEKKNAFRAFPLPE